MINRKCLTLAILLALSASAFAGGKEGGSKPEVNPSSGNNTAIAGAAAIAGAKAVSGIKSNITGGAQDQTLNNSGNGTAQVLGSGNGSGYGGSVYTERSAPSVVVGMQTQPIIDCRRTLGFGGSNTSGSVVASGIPLWKESDCSALMGLEAQAKAGPGAFSVADAQFVACKVEANEDTDTCKKVASNRQAANEAKRPNVAAGPNSTMMP